MRPVERGTEVVDERSTTATKAAVEEDETVVVPRSQ
jgi:hypothetical protein